MFHDSQNKMFIFTKFPYNKEEKPIYYFNALEIRSTFQVHIRQADKVVAPVHLNSILIKYCLQFTTAFTTFFKVPTY